MPQVNKVKITFTKRKMTAYGGFALIVSFLQRIGFAQMIENAIPIKESSPNSKAYTERLLPLSAWSMPAQSGSLMLCILATRMSGQLVRGTDVV
jgi:hypothetical protein